ncbi:hypothetical protein OAU26_05590 [Mariniblastus sp.]|nr:hypothetical protein [Mariniblastus sp.]
MKHGRRWMTRPKLRFLSLPVPAEPATLAGLKNLQRLYLKETEVSDLSPLAGLKNLKWLWLNETKVSDLSPLAGLKNLEALHLNRTEVSEEQVDELQLALPNCVIRR